MKRRQVITMIVAIGLVTMATLRFGPLDRSSQSIEEWAGRLENSRVTMLSTDEAIRFYEARVQRDPQDFMSMSDLSELEHRRARETGDATHYERAETVARQAVALNDKYVPALVRLAIACSAQHKFGEAMELARTAFDLDGQAYAALLVMGDCHMAMGRYAEAEKTYRKLERLSREPAVLARIAHLLELQGEYDEALEIIQAVADAMLKQEEPREEVAWYQTLLGELYFETGRLDRAAKHHQAALRIFKGYHVALVGLGKVRAAEGNWDAAIDYFKRAADVNPHISTLAALADLHDRKGDWTAAQAYFDRIEGLAAQAGTRARLVRRDLALFYADHDMNLAQALDLAQADFADRKDIFAYDAVAWALYKNSRIDEAAAAIDQALKLGGRHPTLCYHAGMIYYGLGNYDRARSFLKRAIAMNPQFSLRYAEDARRTLAMLDETANRAPGS